jgi:hypothetical protein
MKHKTFVEKVVKLGGAVNEKSGAVTFPETLQIKTKSDALNVIDVMRYCNDLEDGDEYSLCLDLPLERLKAAVNQGLA